VTVASKTLRAIEQAINADSGITFRRLQRETLPQCHDAYSEDKEQHRSHLGASIIGRQCGRELWYSFHWAHHEQPEARMLRLWNRGHLEEGRVIALLRMIGVVVHQHGPDGKQIRVSDHNGHFGGSSDAVLQLVPDIPDRPLLGEFKTFNDKTFEELLRKGVRDAKPEHHVQMSIYMRKLGLEWALYVAVNKNTDAIHAELVELAPHVADAHLLRAGHIINSPSPPAKINQSASYYVCRFCDMKAVCHNGTPVAVNCRTCVHARIADAGQWGCALHNVVISKEVQRTGCSSYNVNPALRS
jgi:hypothetical protein